MTITDVIKEVQKSLRNASIMDIVDEARSFVREHSLNSHWKYTYDITLAYSGTATSTASVLTDSTASFAIDGTLIGQTINNTTDGSSGTITAVTATTITATLSGGTSNTWTSGDAYTIAIVNDIHIPKTINYISSMYVGTTYIPMTVTWEGFYNTDSDATDPYSGNVNVPSPDDQSCIIQEDYIVHFVDDVDSTKTLRLWCEKMLTDDISESTLTTELSLPDKMIMPMAFYVLHKLYLYADYLNVDFSFFWERKYIKSYRKANNGINKQKSSRISNGKTGGYYPHQRNVTKLR